MVIHSDTLKNILCCLIFYVNVFR